MSYLCFLCLFAQRCPTHIVLCFCCVYRRVPYVASFPRLSIFECPLGILYRIFIYICNQSPLPRYQFHSICAISKAIASTCVVMCRLPKTSAPPCSVRCRLPKTFTSPYSVSGMLANAITPSCCVVCNNCKIPFCRLLVTKDHYNTLCDLIFVNKLALVVYIVL